MSDEMRCRCAESPEAWRHCPLPEHNHDNWTEHGWNCPRSCMKGHPARLRAELIEAVNLSAFHADPTAAAVDAVLARLLLEVEGLTTYNESGIPDEDPYLRRSDVFALLGGTEDTP